MDLKYTLSDRIKADTKINQMNKKSENFFHFGDYNEKRDLL